MPETPDGDAAPSRDGDRSGPVDGATFDLSGTPARASFPAGTSLLLTGPPAIDKRPILTMLLTAGWSEESGVVVATTESRTAALFETLTDAGAPADRIALVASGAGGAPPDDATLFHRIEERADFSSLGVGLSKCLAGVEHAGATRPRVGVESLSTLLRERDRDDVLKFCRITTDRLEAQDALSVFVADETHDAATLGMLEHVFDARIQVREAGDGLEARIVGPPRVVADWAPVESI